MGKETEDQAFTIINTMSDGFYNTSKSDISTNKSIRSNDSNLLSYLRNQSKKSKQNDDLALKEGHDSYEENSQGDLDIKTKKSKNDNELAANPPKQLQDEKRIQNTVYF